jgi:hypothetical protein
MKMALYIKALAPGGGLNYSKPGLDSRNGYCSITFSCNDAYVYIPSGNVLWSYYTIPYGDGDSLGRNSEGASFDFSGSTIQGGGAFLQLQHSQ